MASARGPGLIAVTVAAVALSGCGGSGGGGSTKKLATAPPPASPAPAVSGATPAPTPAPRGAAPRKARYIKRANQICRTASGRLVTVRSKTIGAGNPADPQVVFKRTAALTGQAASVYDNTLGGLQGLTPPPADQAEIDRLNRLLAQLAGINHTLSAAAQAQNSGQVKALSIRASGAADRYSSAARAYGLRSCATTAQLAVYRRGNR
jgi:hypothetical protein